MSQVGLLIKIGLYIYIYPKEHLCKVWCFSLVSQYCPKMDLSHWTMLKSDGYLWSYGICRGQIYQLEEVTLADIKSGYWKITLFIKAISRDSNYWLSVTHHCIIHYKNVYKSIIQFHDWSKIVSIKEIQLDNFKIAVHFPVCNMLIKLSLLPEPCGHEMVDKITAKKLMRGLRLFQTFCGFPKCFVQLSFFREFLFIRISNNRVVGLDLVFDSP